MSAQLTPFSRASGLWPVARWRLGEALRKVARAQGHRSDKKTLSVGLTKFRDLLKALGIDRQTAHDIQRLAAMPWSEALKYRDMARSGWVASFSATEYAGRPAISGHALVTAR